MEEYIVINKKWLEDKLKYTLEQPIFTDEQDNIQSGTIWTLEDILRRGINLQPIIEDAFDKAAGFCSPFGSQGLSESEKKFKEKYIRNLKIK